MKTEEINPGDILYEKERNLLVKVARVDEDGVVKCSAYTDMERIFKTVPPPYRVGTPPMPIFRLLTCSASIWREIWQYASM